MYINGRQILFGIKTVADESANALKGSASGVNAVAINDVSPIAHKIQIGLKAKNLISNPFASINVEDGKTYTFSFQLKDGVTLSSESKYFFEWYTAEGIWQNHNFIDSGAVQSNDYTFTAGADGAYGYNISYDGMTADMFERVQLEEGATATEYAPYVEDINAVQVKSYGKNIVNITTASECWDKIASSRRVYNLEDLPQAQLTISIELIPNNTLNGNLWVQESVNGGTYEDVARLWDGLKTKKYTFTPKVGSTYRLWTSAAGFENLQKSLASVQIELGASQTEHEEYKTPINGAIWVYPTTTLLTDTAGVVIEAIYNRDVNKAFAALEAAIVNA